MRVPPSQIGVVILVYRSVFQTGDVRRPYRRLRCDNALDDVVMWMASWLETVPDEFRTRGNEYTVFRDTEFRNVPREKVSMGRQTAWDTYPLSQLCPTCLANILRSRSDLPIL